METAQNALRPPKKTWRQSVNPDSVERQRTFFDTRVKHAKFDKLLDDLMPLLTPHSESNIVVITGATGVGKSTLTRILLKALFDDFSTTCDQDKSVIPLIAVEAYANGETRHSFRGLYEDMLVQLHEPARDKKAYPELEDGRMLIKQTSRATIGMLRKSVENALKNRKTQVCVVDEAYHMMRFGKDAAVMDTLKSLANTTGVKWVLVGSFDLFDLVSDHGQIARRTSLLNLDRYRLEDSRDRAEFKQIVTKLQRKWPCQEVPNFAAISDELLEVSLGCVGLLKSLLLDASAMQLGNAGAWKGDFLRKAAKANTLRRVIAQEIEQGEAKVRGALFGESFWDDQAFEALQNRMGGCHA
ncbi:MAG: AAA family ATPase [Burkholderiales bacterium]|nr:AAA family ATPase [Burkholderiales bacterium]